jgi:hypothetical protein
MGIELLRIAAEQGLVVAGRAGGAPGWRATCQRCAGWLELPARPPDPDAAVWWMRRICAFATRHRHPRRPAGALVSSRAVR